MRAAVKARQDADRAKTGPHDELQMYLTSPLEHVENVVSWWGVCFCSNLSCFIKGLMSIYSTTPHSSRQSHGLRGTT
jgi:hypothetical protein